MAGNVEVRQAPKSPFSEAIAGYFDMKTSMMQRDIEQKRKREDFEFQNELLVDRTTQMAELEDRLLTNRTLKNFALETRLGEAQAERELDFKRDAAMTLTAVSDVNVYAANSDAAIRSGEIKAESAPEIVSYMLENMPLFQRPEYAEIRQQMAVENQDPAKSRGVLRRLAMLGRQSTAGRQPQEQQGTGLTAKLEEGIAFIEGRVQAGDMTPEAGKQLAIDYIAKILTGSAGPEPDEGGYSDADKRMIQEHFWVKNAEDPNYTLQDSIDAFDAAYGGKPSPTGGPAPGAAPTGGEGTYAPASREKVRDVIDRLRRDLRRRPEEAEVEEALNAEGLTGTF